MIETYRALALQVRCEAVNKYTHNSDARKCILNNIENIGQAIFASKAFIGSDLKLVVLPEYVLTGFPMGEDFLQWQQKACLVKDGAEYRELGKIAQKNNMYIAGNAYECDEHFPNLYFQSCFIIAPEGNVALRYRRLNSLYSPTPHDVWNKYLEIYGYESLFPVLNSPLGRLACVASEEILFPELTRCLAMRGAEILLHSTSEAAAVGTQITPKDAAKISRSVENGMYVVSANTAGISGTPLPSSSADGGSKIVDFNGRIVAQAGTGESMCAFSEVDVNALRAARRRVGLTNLLCRQRFELYAQSYAQNSFCEPNALATEEQISRQFFRTRQQENIESLILKKII